MVELFKGRANSNSIELTLCGVFSDLVTYMEPACVQCMQLYCRALFAVLHTEKLAFQGATLAGGHSYKCSWRFPDNFFSA